MSLYPCPCAACGQNFTEANFPSAVFVEVRSKATGNVERKGPFHEGCLLKGRKTFTFKHLVFGNEETWHEGHLPSWLTHKENRWFLEGHVLTLGVGAHVDTEFWRIERTA